MSLATDFKEFILRGNVVDLAVGVAIGAAFGAVVKSFSTDIIAPLIGMVGFKSDFATYTVTVNNQHFGIGDLVNNIVLALITALIIFLCVVKPVNNLMEKSKKEEDPTTKACPECLTDIPVAAKRCSACTSVVA